MHLATLNLQTATGYSVHPSEVITNDFSQKPLICSANREMFFKSPADAISTFEVSFSKCTEKLNKKFLSALISLACLAVFVVKLCLFSFLKSRSGSLRNVFFNSRCDTCK